jgi:hypothetical protein
MKIGRVAGGGVSSGVSGLSGRSAIAYHRHSGWLGIGRVPAFGRDILFRISVYKS